MIVVVAPIVGITANCVENTGTYLKSHAVFDAYVSFVAVHVGCLPVIVPCLGFSQGAFSPSAILDAIDGLLLPGSLSNVHPSRYGAAMASGVSANFDERRDETTLPLIRMAVERGLPVLGICRGAQEINCAFGGSLHQSVHTFPDCLDHRARGGVAQHLKYGPVHSLVPSPSSWLEVECLRRGLTAGDLRVNSLHGQAIGELGTGLVADARAPDGIIEAISMPRANGFMVGVQWHPEWHIEESKINAIILDTFRSAVHRYHSTRSEIGPTR